MKVMKATNNTYIKKKEQVDNEINLLKGKEHKNIQVLSKKKSGTKFIFVFLWNSLMDLP